MGVLWAWQVEFMYVSLILLLIPVEEFLQFHLNAVVVNPHKILRQGFQSIQNYVSEFYQLGRGQDGQ